MTQYFNQSMKYSPDQVGSTIFTEKMANLADDHPAFMERLDNALNAEYICSDSTHDINSN